MIELVVSTAIPFVYIIGLAVLNALFFKKRIENCICIAFLESSIVLYVFGFFDLRIGLWLCIFASLFGIGKGIKIAIEEGIKKTVYVFLTPEMIAFTLLLVITSIINYGKQFSHWDEISHWGIMAKDLYYTNRFYIFDTAKLTFHNEYPPLMAIVEYLWCKLSLGYNESFLYNGKIIFSFALMLTLMIGIEKDTNSNNKKTFLNHVITGVLKAIILLTIPLIVVIGEATFYRTIYAESLMVILFVVAILDCVFDDRTDFGLLQSSLLLSALIISKQIAVVFVCFVFVLWVMRWIIERAQKKQITYKELFVFGLPAIVGLVWKIATSIFCSDGQFSVSEGRLGGIIDVFFGRDNTYRTEVLERYISYLSTYKLEIGRFRCTYFQGVLIIPIVIMVLALVARAQIKKIEILYLSLLELLYIGYSFLMLVTYMFGFNEYEALSIACYPRYMKTMLFVVVITCIFWIMIVCRRRIDERNLLLWTVCSLIMLFVVNPSVYGEELKIGKFYETNRDLYVGDQEFVTGNIPENASIFVIYQGTNGSANNWLQYLAYPRTVSDRYYSLGSPYYDEDVYTSDVELGELCSTIKEYEYLYLGNVDEQFIDKYGELFYDKKLIVNQALFRINKTNDTITLEYVGRK